MSKQKQQDKEFQEIIKILPAREREKLKLEELNKEWLTKEIAKAEKAVKFDMYIGLPWFIIYCISLYQTGFSKYTITIFFIGLVYFVHAVFTRGSYGENAKRIKVYTQLLKII